MDTSNVERVPDFVPPVTELFKLTEAEFAPASFKSACEKFSRFDEPSSDDDLWNFYLPDTVETYLTVSVYLQSQEPTAIICAIFPFCWWETYSRKDHKDDKSFHREQNEFNRIYEEELKHAIDEIGQPEHQGADSKEPRHKYAIWRGKNALLILQQSDHDVQFGYNINYWIQPWNREKLTIEGCLVDWLAAQNSIPRNITMPNGWAPCGPGLENELKREIELNLFHALKNVQATSVARAGYADDVLFELHGHKHKLAMVHLTWTKEFRPSWPETTFFDSWTEWVEAMKKFEPEGDSED